MTEVRSDFKAPSRHVATRTEWDAIVLAKAGPCRSCGAPGQSFHHLVPKSLGGADIAANIVPLCGDGTRGCHGALETHPPGWEEIGHSVRASLTPLELAYVKAKKGARWVDRYLPAGGELCAKCKRVKTPKIPGEAPRRRKNFIVRVPDDAENGAAILSELIAMHRDRLADALGWTESVADYYVLTAMLAEPLSAPKARVA